MTDCNVRMYEISNQWYHDHKPCGRPKTLTTVGESYDIVSRKRKTDDTDLVTEHRRASNQAKRALLEHTLHARKDSFVLDLGIGRGGDMGKYAAEYHAGFLTGIVGLDASVLCLEEAAKRSGTYHMPCRLFLADLCKTPWGHELHALNCPRFDIVTSMFSIHYCVGTEAQWRHVLRQLSEVMEPDGELVGITLRHDATFHGPGIAIDAHVPPTPTIGAVIRVRIGDLVTVDEYAVDWAALEPILLEYGFYLYRLSPMPSPVDVYEEFTLRRWEKK
jgi:SAM-dependent methyltransferase